MNVYSRDLYLETQINTASPQKLRLLLVEGALRFARQALEHWQTANYPAAAESLLRCREIASELLAGVSPEASPLARQVSEVYVYLFSLLGTAQRNRDEQLLAAAIRILEEERETWRQVCEQMPDRPALTSGPHFAPREELAPMSLNRTDAFSIEA
jgi:flagellar protein FliS